MNLLVVGGGGREHAIIQSLKKNPSVTKIYALPGNGGIAADAECAGIAATDIGGIVNFAKTHDIGFAVVAPDDPLVLGCADELEQLGIPVFGPRKNAAIIEGSKVFSKRLMQKYNIPTAAYAVFTDLKEALAYIEDAPIPTVIKADGLALGKGVIIAQTRQEAKNALRSMLEDKIFGESGSRVIIEEFLTGPEVSVLSFTDGETVVPMISSMDHKRAKDGDQGLNTGGMGTIAPNPYYTAEVARECMETIFLPTIRAMKAEGRPFRGCLYFGLMLTPDGPKVIEYNCRFGDPETQVVLPLLETDLLTIMQAVAAGKLSQVEVKWKDASAACVVMASDGYPTHYEKGFPITLPDLGADEHIFIAGAKLQEGTLVTSGGRVLGAVSVKSSLKEAVDGAYALAERIRFGNAYYRRDIGQRALAAKEEQ
ncbi:MAG: phosphoribosylamine--glycine ligase [Butyricicoccaceae bacterium]